MVMVDRSGWMDTPKLIMWPITSAAFSEAFAFASAAFAFAAELRRAIVSSVGQPSEILVLIGYLTHPPPPTYY